MVWAIEIALAIGDVSIALLGMAIIAALVPLGELTANILARLPFPLSIAAKLAAAAFEDAVKGTIAWTQASADGLASVIQAPWQAIWTVQREALVATAKVADAVWRVRYQALPAVEAQLVAYVQSLAGEIIQYAAGLVAQAEARADAEVASVARYAGELVAGAEARADAEIVDVEHFVESTAATVTAYAGQLAVDVERAAEAGDQVVADYASALAGDVLAEAVRLVAGAEALAESIGIASQDFTREAVGAAEAEAGAAIAVAAAAATAAIAGVAVRVSEIEDSPCQRACSPLGDIGQLVQGLEDAGLLAILLGVVAEALHDPKTLATELQDATVVPARAAMAALSGLGIVR